MSDVENATWDEFLQSPQFIRAIQRMRDEEHLSLVSVGFYIMGGITLLFSLFFIIYIAMGVMMAHSPSMWQEPSKPGSPPIPEQFNPGYFLVIFGAIAMLICWIFGGLSIAAGRWVSMRKSYVGIQVVASIICLNVPVGTVLGVFALTTLGRPSVRALFGIPDPYSTADIAYVQPRE